MWRGSEKQLCSRYPSDVYQRFWGPPSLTYVSPLPIASLTCLPSLCTQVGCRKGGSFPKGAASMYVLSWLDIYQVRG